MRGIPTREQVAQIKEEYPIGTRIKLISMDDPYSPIAAGTEGEIVGIDACGTFLMKWDNGRTLGLVPFEDSFEVLSRPKLSQKTELLSVESVVLNSQNLDYTDKIVVLKAEKLNAEHRMVKNQLWVATHGPGCLDVQTFTGTVYLTHPIDGDTMCVHRSEILGIAKAEIVEKYLENQEQSQKQDEQMEIGGMNL